MPSHYVMMKIYKESHYVMMKIYKESHFEFFVESRPEKERVSSDLVLVTTMTTRISILI